MLAHFEEIAPELFDVQKFVKWHLFITWDPPVTVEGKLHMLEVFNVACVAANPVLDEVGQISHKRAVQFVLLHCALDREPRRHVVFGRYFEDGRFYLSRQLELDGLVRRRQIKIVLYYYANVERGNLRSL